MSNHQKRRSAPDWWPIERKTKTFVPKARAGPHGKSGFPIVILLRDILSYANTRKEVKYILNNNTVEVNHRPVSDENFLIGMFDVISFHSSNEFFRISPGKNGYMSVSSITKLSAQTRLGKIIKKQHVTGGDTQFTLQDGWNLRKRGNVGYERKDSLMIDKSNNIIGHYPFVEGVHAAIVGGNHIGQTGIIETIKTVEGSPPNQVVLSTSSDEKFKTIEKYVFPVDEAYVIGIEETTMSEEINDDLSYYSRLFALLANGVEPLEIVHDKNIPHGRKSRVEINNDIMKVDSAIRDNRLNDQQKEAFAQEYVNYYSESISGTIPGGLNKSEKENIKEAVIDDLRT